MIRREREKTLRFQVDKRLEAALQTPVTEMTAPTGTISAARDKSSRPGEEGMTSPTPRRLYNRGPVVVSISTCVVRYGSSLPATASSVEMTTYTSLDFEQELH